MITHKDPLDPDTQYASFSHYGKLLKKIVTYAPGLLKKQQKMKVPSSEIAPMLIVIIWASFFQKVN